MKVLFEMRLDRLAMLDVRANDPPERRFSRLLGRLRRVYERAWNDL
jgi:hypothetical protein